MGYLLRPIHIRYRISNFRFEFYACFVLSSLGWFVMEIASRSNEFHTQFGDFGFGYLFFGSFSQTVNALWLLLIFGLGVKILKFRSQSKGFVESERKTRTAIDDVPTPKNRITEENGREEEEEEEDGEEESNSEKEETVVKTLRKMVKKERKRRKKAEAELEKERMAAATAAEEAMAMILRLQREKSVIEIQANQDRRMAEQRQQHDQQVIGYLEKMAMNYEQESWEKKVNPERENDLEKSFRSSTMEDLEDE